jgi:Ca2+-dependent lipid-binding protein
LVKNGNISKGNAHISFWFKLNGAEAEIRQYFLPFNLFSLQGKRIGKKKKTSVKSCNLNPYWNESFVFLIDEMDMKRVVLDVTVSHSSAVSGLPYVRPVTLGFPPVILDFRLVTLYF